MLIKSLYIYTYICIKIASQNQYRIYKFTVISSRLFLFEASPIYYSLFIACQNGHTATAALLLDRGAAVDLQNNVSAICNQIFTSVVVLIMLLLCVI